MPKVLSRIIYYLRAIMMNSGMSKFDDYIKAIRKGNRDAVLENENGWKAVDKVHPSKKTYNRKAKHKDEPSDVD